jgi:hypothetical protein
MLFNHILGIYCFYCNEYKDPYKVFINVTSNDSVTCEKGHLLGFTYDQTYEEFFRQDD